MKRELSDAEFKKLNSIKKRIIKCAEELQDMNCVVYFNSGNMSIMDSDKHMNGLYSTPDNDNELFKIYLEGFNWDGGDW